MPLLYEDLVKAQTVNPPKYDQQGMVIPGTGTLPTLTGPAAQNLNQSYQPLPQVSPQATPQRDPLTIFNTALLDLLKRAQTASNPATLLNERNRLGIQQTTQSMAPASQLGIEGLTPSDALRARGTEAELYNPEIRNLTDRIQASAQAVSNFQNAIESARKFGEDYAKYVKPDDATIQAVKDQMAAGFVPSADVLERIGKYLTAEDWTKAAAAKKASSASGQPTSVEEYEYAKTQGYKGTYQQWVDRPSQYKPNELSPTEIKNAKLLAAENKTDSILSAQRGTDQYVSPQAWYAAREAWKTDGFSASDFDSKFKRYTNPADPQDYGLS